MKQMALKKNRNQRSRSEMSKYFTKSERFYNNFADEFDRKMNKYDLQRRLDIVFNELLPHDISGKRLLDAGCGTGHFSRLASEKGAIVTSLDIGEKLLEKVAEKCNTERVIGSVLDMRFNEDYFDFVISSEVIEHTENPYGAIREFYRVLKPGGILALTVPNRFWKWSCTIANALKIRPYEGMENWVGHMRLKRELKTAGFCILQCRGFHLLPFQLKFLHPFLLFMDRFGDNLGPLYINIAASCQKYR
jgi:2-polyprenyl-6-hydroxyphenyl methylase/3-demethylubiquinone-9 3-methyltransferase